MCTKAVVFIQHPFFLGGVQGGAREATPGNAQGISSGSMTQESFLVVLGELHGNAKD